MENELPFIDDEPLFMRLAKIAPYDNLSYKQQMQYDDSYNNFLAYQGVIEYNRKEGFEQGFEQGFKQGFAEGKKQGLAAAHAANLLSAYI